MTMGYGAAFALTLDMDELKTKNIAGFCDFLTEIDRLAVPLETIQYVDKQEREDADGDADSLTTDKNERGAVKAFRKFQKRFQAETGMPICIDYHDSENDGSSPDEVDGIFFSLPFESVYRTTPEADALKKRIDIKLSQFVIFG